MMNLVPHPDFIAVGRGLVVDGLRIVSVEDRLVNNGASNF
jgi:hypothetical protein